MPAFGGVTGHVYYKWLGSTFLCVSEPAVVAIARPLTHGVRGPGSGNPRLWLLGGTAR